MNMELLQRTLRTQTAILWGILGLLALNFVVLIGGRVGADGDASQRVKIDGPVQVEFMGNAANAKPIEVKVAEWPNKPLPTTTGK